MEGLIRKELANGRYVRHPGTPSIISALGAVPKKGADGLRLIHDASRPQGAALNDLAVNEHFSYETLEGAAALVSPGGFMGKVDLTAAYRSVKVHPHDHDKAGLEIGRAHV